MSTTNFTSTSLSNPGLRGERPGTNRLSHATFFIETNMNLKFYIRIQLIYLINVNTTLFTLKHSYIFQPPRGIPQGVLIHFVSKVNKLRVQT